MSQFSFSSFDASLMVRDAQGHYQPATADQILDAAVMTHRFLLRSRG